MALSASSGLSEGVCGESVQVPTRLAIDGIQGGSTGRGTPDEEPVCLVSVRIPGWGLEAVGVGRDAATLRASTAAQGSLGSGSVARKHTARAGADRRISRDRISGAYMYAERTLPSVGACYPRGTLPSAGACYPPVGAVRGTIGARARAKSSKGSMQCRRGPCCGGVIRA